MPGNGAVANGSGDKHRDVDGRDLHLPSSVQTSAKLTPATQSPGPEGPVKDRVHVSNVEQIQEYGQRCHVGYTGHQDGIMRVADHALGPSGPVVEELRTTGKGTVPMNTGSLSSMNESARKLKDAAWPDSVTGMATSTSVQVGVSAPDLIISTGEVTGGDIFGGLVAKGPPDANQRSIGGVHDDALEGGIGNKMHHAKRMKLSSTRAATLTLV